MKTFNSLRATALLLMAGVSLPALAQEPAGNCVFFDLAEFNQTQQVQYFDCGNDNAFNLGSEATIQVWVRFNNDNTTSFNQKLVGKTNANFNSGYVLGMTTGRVYPEIWSPANNNMQEGFLAPQAVWYHLAVTYKAGDQMIGYVNGENVHSQATIGSNPISDNLEPLIIGIAPWDQANFMTFAEIDEVRIWNKALSEEEMRNTMFKALDGNEAGLVAYYDFNETTGANLTDQGPNGLDGTGTNINDDDWLPSKAVLGDAPMQSMNDLHGIWTGLGLGNPRFALTTNGLSMNSDMNDLDYVVFGHNGMDGTATSDAPSGAGSSFERMARMWYATENGQVTADLTFDVNEGAGSGTALSGSDPKENYVLLYRAGTSGAFSAVSSPNILNNNKVIFQGVDVQTGYYTLGLNDAPLAFPSSIAENGTVNQAFSVYPNPSNGEFNLALDASVQGPVDIRVFNSLGQVIEQREVEFPQGQVLNFQTDERGLFYVVLTTGGEQFTRRLVIE